MSKINHSLYLSQTPAQVLGDKIMCCRGIRVSKQKSPSTDLARHAERMMYFLCSYWAGKEIDQDANTSASELFTAANFSGVIKLSKQGTTDELSGATDARWIASYHPDHPKASKLAPIGSRGTGPDGRYMEISESKVMEEINAGRLIHTNIEIQYGSCKTHRDEHCLATWFDFRNDLETINPSTELVVSGILGKVGSASTERRCNKCKKNTPEGEYRVNIYNGNLTPGHCTACQGYRHYDEPPRTPRVKKAGRNKAVQNGDQAYTGKKKAGTKSTVHNTHRIRNSRRGRSTHTVRNDETFDNAQTITDNSANQGPASRLGVGTRPDIDMDTSQIIDNSQTLDDGYDMQIASSKNNIDPGLLDPRLFDSKYEIQDNDEDLYGAD